MMASLAIDTVDFSAFMLEPNRALAGDPTPEQQNVAKQINRAFREDGFMFLKNFGLAEDDLTKTFDTARKLFSLPEDMKMSNLKRIERESNIGFVPYGLEGLNRRRGPDIKEAYNFKSRRVYDHDFCGCPPGFEQMSQAFWDKMEYAALTLATACAMALDLPVDFFRKTMKLSDLTTFRFIHYPPCDYEPGLSTGDDCKAALRVGEHTDFGMFTILFTDGPGLQVKAVEGASIGGVVGGEEGGWRDVPIPTGGTAIVNTGALMARWTNDVWRATAHRVVVTDEEQAAKDRYSIACFFEPDKGAVVDVDPSFVADGEKPKYPPISGYEHLLAKLREAQGAGKDEN